jgi:hypothetical protein
VDLPSGVRPVSVGIVRVGWRYLGLVSGPEPSVHDPEKCRKPSFSCSKRFSFLNSKKEKYLRGLQLRFVASIKVAFAT